VVQRKTLSDRTIRALPPAEDKTAYYWDARMRNFGVRVSQHGVKSFVVMLGNGRRKTLGRYPDIGLARAREEAQRLLAEKRLGKNFPRHTAFADARERFLSELERTAKPLTLREYRRVLEKRMDFGRTSVADVTPQDILAQLDKLNHTAREKQHVYTVTHTFFNWCLRRHLIDHHPMRAMEKPKWQSSKERVLTDAEIAEVYSTALATEDTFHRIVALLILTGQRRGEIAGLRWEWIDFDQQHITFPAHFTKNRREHRIPLNDKAAEILASTPRLADNPYVFPASRNRRAAKPATTFGGWSKSFTAFKSELAQTEPFSLHDLRRTFSTKLAELGVSQIVTEKLLNHVTGSQTPIAAVYNKYNYMSEMREALHIWQEHLHTLYKNS